MANKTGTVAFFTAMAGCVPLQDESQVRDHLEAHRNYVTLTKRKKELLLAYKAAKEEERIAKSISEAISADCRTISFITAAVCFLKVR